jgi:ZIP family zinc transporter
MAGGVLALKLKDRLHLILGFSAGAVVAVAFFDLIPEAVDLASSAYGTTNVLSFVALGFVLYLLLDRLLLLHSHAHEDHETPASDHVRAGSLSLHSFLDGVGIGLAFQVSATVGTIVALAVLAHDFSDGINTVSVIVRHGGERSSALKWLVVDALAPILGVAATLFFSVSPQHLGILLALFGGFFLFIGASDLVPESHHVHPTFWTTAMTILGVAVLFGAIRLASL